MAEKLKSVWKIPKLKLGVKALVLGVSFFYLPFWASALIASFFYFYPALNTEKLLTSFLFSLFLGFSFSDGSIPLADFWLVPAFIFYLLLGVKDMVFLNGKAVYVILNASMMIALFFGVFSGVISPWLLPFLLFLLFREFFAMVVPEYPKRAILFGSIFSLISFEIFWIYSWFGLPVVLMNRLWISPWYADMIGALFVFLWLALPLSLSLGHLSGRIRPKIIFCHLAGMAALIALTLVIVF